ncbi:MAG TPA: inositol monophosphatase family protein, partial [Actinomycetes bacterium]|nr:inositol monophosphatase family protein [Actinomycetes bacterium]
MDDHALAHRLADRAGTRLLALRERPDVLDVGAAGDRSSHEYIAAQLATARPDDAVLSEEAADDRARLAADRVWIVDPLDG